MWITAMRISGVQMEAIRCMTLLWKIISWMNLPPKWEVNFIFTRRLFLIIAMFGITNGELDPVVTASTTVDSATGKLNKYAPAFHAKLGLDKQWKNLRVRLTASVYADKSANDNTLFFGDRTGSRYYFVIENTAATSDDNAWSGRIDPGFDEQVKTFMINPFVKFHGLELFGTYEMAWGRMITEKTDREVTQGAVDLVYRFPRKRKIFGLEGVLMK